MAFWFPIDIEIPTSALLTPAVRIPMFSETKIMQVSGHLRALTLGTFEIELRDQDNDLLATLTWTSNGIQKIILEDPQPTVDYDGHIRFDVTSLGTGALGCQMTVWGQSE